ncbi:hypothetical protein ABPG75_010667 [Micractinium tetrahymenae]
MGAACSKGGLSRVSVSPSPDEGPAKAPAPSQAPQRPPSLCRRLQVSAEPSGTSTSNVKRLDRLDQLGAVAKPDESREKIQGLVRNTLLFRELDDDQQAAIIDAMFERRVDAGEVVIRQGEEADNFYVIEAGRFEATKLPASDNSGAPASGPPVRVATYEGCGSFGELALMYNCPRAATVTALTEGVLWGVDRSTFRSLVVHSMAERRQRYEATLRGMAVFRHLSQEQLAAVADCLHQEVFKAGEYILWEGAPLDDSAKFYIIESGQVDCFRTFEGQKRAVKTLTAGDVFGEVALLTKAPRQADCVAASRCKCLTLSRDAFERLMGPVEQSLAQQIAAYAQSNAAASAVAAATAGAPASAAAAGAAGDHSGAAAAARQRAPTPPPASARGGSGVASPTHASGTGGSAAALLPGSPRPRGHSSDQSSPGGYSWRRSRRGTGSEAGDSPGSQSSSPLASLLASHDAHGAAADGTAAGGEAAEGDGAELLPTIAEEPTLDAAGAAAAAAAAAEFAAAADAQEQAAAAAAAESSSKAASRATKTPAAAAAGSKAGAAKKPAAASGTKKKAGK